MLESNMYYTQISKKKTKIGFKVYELFCVFLFLYSFFYVLESSQLSEELVIFSPLLNLIQGLMICIGLLLIFQKQLSVKKWIFLACISSLLLISTFLSNTQSFLIILFFCIVVKDESVDRAISYLIHGILFGCIFVVLVYLFNLIPESVHAYYRDGELRYSLGFYQPVVLPGYYLGYGLGYLYLNRHKINYVKLIILQIPAVFIGYFTASRASFYSLVITSIIIVFFNLSKKSKLKKSTFLYYCSFLIYFGGLVISVFVANYYGSMSILYTANEIFTGRVFWFSRYWNLYNPTLFGQEITRVGSVTAAEIGESMMILDNAHLSMILENGLIVFVIFTVLLILLLKKLKNNGDYVSLIIWIVAFLNFVVGNNFLTFWRNPLLFQFSYLLLSEMNVTQNIKNFREN